MFKEAKYINLNSYLQRTLVLSSIKLELKAYVYYINVV